MTIHIANFCHQVDLEMEKNKGKLTLPLSQSKSAAVEDIIDRDGNDINNKTILPLLQQY